jgi:hypothetical protein
VSQINKARDFIIDRQSKLSEEIFNFKKQKETIENLIVQLDKDKKAFAAAKKFKDAGRCQTELKENQSKLSNVDQ